MAGSAAPWYGFHDDLPQHDEYPPEWNSPPGIKEPERLPETRGATPGSCLCGECASDRVPPVAEAVDLPPRIAKLPGAQFDG